MKCVMWTMVIVMFVGHKRCIYGQNVTLCDDGDDFCFDNGYPWSYILRPVPEPDPREEVDTIFYYFYDSEQDPIEVTTWPNISLEGTHFNPTWQTYFITHGFGSQSLDTWVEDLSRAIVATMPQSNVFAVDWSQGASGIYFSAVSNTRVAGAEISRVMKYMISNFHVSKTQFHLIGHSLGAQVVAYASNGVGGVYWVTGLDPAQPLYQGYDPIVYLDKSDACFVDIVHTNAKPFLPYLGLGFVEPIGDVDFYVNGGYSQPGCNVIEPLPDNVTLMDAINSMDLSSIDLTCSHIRSYMYYEETIRNSSCVMWGHQDSDAYEYVMTLTNGNLTSFPNITSVCSLDSCSPIGLNVIEYPARGPFLVTTEPEYPYCISEPSSDKQMASQISNYENSHQQNTTAMCATKAINL